MIDPILAEDLAVAPPSIWAEMIRRHDAVSNYPKMEAGIRDLVAELVRLQGDGDYAGTKAFFDRYARLDDQARAVLATTSHIPTDIQPIYPSRV